jgi:hypothetical protein
MLPVSLQVEVYVGDTLNHGEGAGWQYLEGTRDTFML